jgi:hypothetical protein
MKFNLDQVNFNNRGAGTTKLDGEIKDGKYLHLQQTVERNWVGTYANGKFR